MKMAQDPAGPGRLVRGARDHSGLCWPLAPAAVLRIPPPRRVLRLGDQRMGDGIQLRLEATARRYQVEILLISFAALLLEVAYTRVISFKLFYYYTYLVIGLALLGIGAGGVLVAISGRLRRASTESILMWGTLLGAASVAVGFLIVAETPIASLLIWDYGSWESVSNLGRLLVICLALFASFVAIGIMLATLFGRRPDQAGRLYFADLLGAGLACAVVVSLLGSIGSPATIMLAGLVLSLAALRIALRNHFRAVSSGAALLSLLLAMVVVSPGLLPDPDVDAVKVQGLDNDSTLYSSWSPVFRVDAAQYENRRVLFHDGLVGSAIWRYNGDPSTLGRFDRDTRSIPFAGPPTSPHDVLIIGAAGGHEILASLRFQAKNIDAVELNPVTHSLVSDRFARYAGNIAQNPKVDYIKGDGRSYLARSDDTYDLVWFPAPDSYSATNASTAGAFVLSESYLYTSEMIEESLEHLSRGGLVATQFGEANYSDKPNRTSRYISTARHALAERGVNDPSRHVLVATTPSDFGPGEFSTILLKGTPFTPAEVDRFAGQLDVVSESSLEYAPGRPLQDNAVTKIATLSDDQLDSFYESNRFRVDPITDDRPFFWHFTAFGDVVTEFGEPITDDLEDSTGERMLVLLVLCSVLLAAVFLLLPFVTIREVWAVLPQRRRSALYFAAIGLGFMFFEITLIQRLTLFLGYPTYSLTVTLASILIFTGVGALLSERYRERTDRIVPVLLVAIVILTAFYQFGLPPLTGALLDFGLVARWLVAFVVLAPLGLCLGAFMPIGLGAVAALSTFSREYVAWGWAINGFASVVGSALTTILAMSFGFRVVLFVALLIYLVALVTLRGLLQGSSAGHRTTEASRDTPVRVPAQ
jgi:MFS family permease